MTDYIQKLLCEKDAWLRDAGIEFKPQIPATIALHIIGNDALETACPKTMCGHICGTSLQSPTRRVTGRSLQPPSELLHSHAA